MPPVEPVPAYIIALITAIGNATVAFGAFNNTIAASLESAVVGLVAVGFVIANALHHSANAKLASARLAAPSPVFVHSTPTAPATPPPAA